MRYIIVLDFSGSSCKFIFNKVTEVDNKLNIEILKFINNDSELLLFSKTDYKYFSDKLLNTKYLNERFEICGTIIKNTLKFYKIDNVEIILSVSGGYLHQNYLLNKNEYCNVNNFDKYDNTKHNNYMSDKCTNNIRILLDKYKHHLINDKINENIKINMRINTDEGLYECLSFINDVKSVGHKKLQKGPYLLFFCGSTTLQIIYFKDLDYNKFSNIERKTISIQTNTNIKYKKQISENINILLKEYDENKQLQIHFGSGFAIILNVFFFMINRDKYTELLDFNKNTKSINHTIFDSIFNIKNVKNLFTSKNKDLNINSYNTLQVVYNYIIKNIKNYNIYSFLGKNKTENSPAKGVILKNNKNRYFLIKLGPTGSGKGSLDYKVTEYLNKREQRKLNYKWKTYSIDDYVEINKGYKNDFDKIVKGYCNGKVELCDTLTKKIENYDKDFINKIEHSYFKNRFLTHCDTGNLINKKEESLTVDKIIKKKRYVSSKNFKKQNKKSCTNKLYTSLLKSIEDNENIIFETQGVCSDNNRNVIDIFIDKFFNLKDIIKTILDYDYDIIYAYSIASICELINRNKSRGLRATQKYIQNYKKNKKTLKTPRFPNVKFKNYKKKFKKIMKCLDILIDKCVNAYDCDIKPHILVFDNTTENSSIVYDSYSELYKDKKILVKKILDYNVKYCN